MIVVLTGFDIEGVRLQCVDSVGVSESQQVERSTGALSLVHKRAFISWAPTDNKFTLPFSMEVTPQAAHRDRIGRIVFSADLEKALLVGGCPETIAKITTREEAMNMLVTLRRAHVKPAVVTYNALLSASRKQETWSSALGIL